MSEAAIGLIGVLVGLAVGRGYSFWSERHRELGKAVVAAAILSEELSAHQPAGARSDERVSESWREYRGAMVIHMSPSDFRRLGEMLEEVFAGDADGAAFDEAIMTMDGLHRLFWEEQEAFILVPLINYLKGNTMSKRIRAILNSSDGADESARQDGSSSLRRWHSPTA